MPEGASTGARKRWREVGLGLAEAVFFLALAIAFTWPLATDLSGATIGGPDPILEGFAIDWATRHLFTDRFFHANIFHPSPYALLYSDFALGSAVLVLPLRLLVSDAVTLVNLATLLAMTFSGWSFSWLVRDLTGDRRAGLLTGVLATFGSHQLQHIAHLNLLSTGWIAWFLFAVLRLAKAPSLELAVLAGVAFSLTAQSSGYYAVILTVVAVLIGAWLWRALADRRFLAFSSLAAGVAILLTLPYLRAYRTLSQQIGMGREESLSAELAFQWGRDLTSRSYLWGSVLGSSGEAMFPGVLALVLAALAVKREGVNARMFGFLFAALFVFGLGPRLELFGFSVPGPYAALTAVPPLDSMRHPYTFLAVGLLLLSVLAGLGAAASGWTRHRVGGAALVAIAILETYGPSPRLVEVPRGLPPVYAELVRHPVGPVLEIAPFNPYTLLWAARTGFPFLNGYGAFGPPYNYALQRQIKNHWRRGAPDEIDGSKPTKLLLEKFDCRYLVLRSGTVPSLRPLADAFDRSTIFQLVSEASDGDRLYQVRQ